jgi:hypothetical protein
MIIKDHYKKLYVKNWKLIRNEYISVHIKSTKIEPGRQKTKQNKTNLNRPVVSKDMESAIKSLPKRKAQTGCPH